MESTEVKYLVLPNAVFFDEILQQISEGKRVCIRAKGSSMLPLIRDEKDKIVLEKLNPKSLHKGNIVLAILPSRTYVIHRIEDINGNKVTLRGDGNLASREHCTTDNILAEVALIHRGKKSIDRHSFFWKITPILWPSHPFLRRICLGVYRRLP